MRVLFFVPHLNTIYAYRTIYVGYKNAFEDLGHQFKFLTADDSQKKVYAVFKPDILFIGLHAYFLKYLNMDLLKKQKKKGLKVFVNTPFWKSPMSKLRINEALSVSENKKHIRLIKSGDFGDVYYHACEQGDSRMEGFEKVTGYKRYTVPLAADKTMYFPEYSEEFKADISYIGTYLPEKRSFIKEQVLPFKKRYDLKLYGQDWTLFDKLLGMVQKTGQYFNLPLLKTLQKPKLQLEDERKIYTSSLVSINFHEDYQRRFGGDCNERTFKIPISGGFEIADDVACIRKYFKEGEEIIIAKDKDDWFDKISYYIKNPNKRLKIIKAGRKRVLRDHTYHNRVKKFIKIYHCI